MTPLEAVPSIVEAVNREISDRLRELLQTKHLYQRVTADVPAVINAGITALKLRDETFGGILASFEADPFFPSGEQLFIASYGSEQHTPCPVLLLSNLKLWCSSCSGVETFAPVWYGDAVNEMRMPRTREIRAKLPPNASLALYHLVYQCQTCHAEPTAFLVRRSQWTLSLHGRSPMEEVVVPASIPKPERRLYRDAIVAAHGGKILAALFYLRVFIEAFARRVTKTSGRLSGEELMAAYNQSLPDKQRDLMPSLREWYARLSVPIHGAQDDEALFEEAREEIARHFEIRRVFKTPEE